jgi:NAD(P)-dependent dehydrogenase (short-subunit alcohol dehydrogenase family)
MLPPRTFEDTVVVITGGGTGIGRAIAAEFGRLGATVAVTSRKPEHRDEGIVAVNEAGGRGIGIECDVRDPAAVAQAFDGVEQAAGAIGVLVNNAAGNFPVLAEEMSPNAWRAVTTTVLDGTFFCST